ncbi:MAG: DUF2948 family protein [Pseudomonadota bacterium]
MRPKPRKLRLIADDESGLAIIAAAIQDALFLAKETTFLKLARRFSLPLQRFCHESEGENNQGHRAWSLLSFDGVLGVRAKNVSRMSNIPKSILDVKFVAGDIAPSGTIIITLAEQGELALEVECIDVMLGDIGEARAAVRAPNHEDGD